jgi:hypothetical protein
MCARAARRTVEGMEAARSTPSPAPLAAPLRRHLVHDHGRLPLELGEALDAVHRLEHLDAELGLLALDHSHHRR